MEVAIIPSLLDIVIMMDDQVYKADEAFQGMPGVLEWIGILRRQYRYIAQWLCYSNAQCEWNRGHRSTAPIFGSSEYPFAGENFSKQSWEMAMPTDPSICSKIRGLLRAING